MAAWVPVPEPVTWPLPEPVQVGGLTYKEVSLHAPTGADIMKATALAGANNADTTVKLIEAVSGVPADVISQLPWWVIKQMSDYMDEFVGAPSPDPLELWRTQRRRTLAEEAKAEFKAMGGASATSQ